MEEVRSGPTYRLRHLPLVESGWENGTLVAPTQDVHSPLTLSRGDDTNTGPEGVSLTHGCRSPDRH